MKAKLPLPLKRVIRQRILDPIQRALDDMRLRGLVRKIRTNRAPDRELLEALRHAWGNESFVADVSYLGELITRVEECTGPVLECGSGLTTIIAGIIAERRRVPLISLEQDHTWVAFVEQRLHQNGIYHVDLRYTPVREYRGYVWYDLEGLELPKHFELMLCDGPFVADSWAPVNGEWRYGALPALANKGIHVDEILFDDADDPRAENVLQRWKDEFGMAQSLIHSRDGDCAFLTSHDRPTPS